MASFDYDIGIIGGGAAGLTVASGAAQLGAKTILIEREELLGGDCLHYGCVPSKSLIATAKAYHQLSRLEEFGLPEVQAGPVNFAKVSERIKGVIATIQHHDSVERFTGLGVDVQFGEAHFADDHTVNTGVKRVTADKWVVTTGSSPSLPPIPGLRDIEVLTNRDIFYLEKLPESLIVLGGGAIALEMAQAFNRLGSKVTVIQRSDQILSREDRDMADLVMSSLEEEGVTFYLGASIMSVSDAGGHKTVTLKTADRKPRDVRGTDILVALGRTVNTQSLGLENAGVNFSSKGIEVDSRLRSSAKHIFGAGDVIGGYQFTHAAGYEGGVVLTNAVLHLPRKVNYTWMPWCTYTSPELASIGMNEKRARNAGLDYHVHVEQFSDNDRAQAEGGPKGQVKLLLSRKDKPLGVQIAGLHAGDLLSEWVGVLNGNVRMSTVAGAIHPYPTLAEINKRSVGAVLSPKLFSDRVRKALKLLFKYRG